MINYWFITAPFWFYSHFFFTHTFFLPPLIFYPTFHTRTFFLPPHFFTPPFFNPYFFFYPTSFCPSFFLYPLFFYTNFLLPPFFLKLVKWRIFRFIKKYSPLASVPIDQILLEIFPLTPFALKIWNFCSNDF